MSEYFRQVVESIAHGHGHAGNVALRECHVNRAGGSETKAVSTE